MKFDYSDKIKLIRDKINAYPSLFKISYQNNKKTRKYFIHKHKGKYLSKEFLAFMKVFDSFEIGDFNMFSISSIDKEYVVMKYEDYSVKKVNKIFFKKTEGFDPKEYFFIGSDNKQGRYALSRKKENNNVYFFQTSRPTVAYIYNSFFDFLFEKIDERINENKKSINS